MNCFLFLLLLASPKNKQTNKQTNRKNVGRDTAQWLWPIVEGPATNKKKKKQKKHEILKDAAIQKKTTATYNKLLYETRNEHYYILNRQT